MNTLLSLSLLLLASLGLTAAHPDHSDSWSEFKLKFNKKYQSEEDEVRPQTSDFINCSLTDCSLVRPTARVSGPPQWR